MNQIITLSSGLRMAYRYNPNVHSVCWGVFVGVGSADETAQENGISHLIEHMCFKGTTTRTAYDIVRQTDDLGADLNAFTSKEMTAYYVKCVDDCVAQCCEILGDIVLHHTFDEAELAREKEVVCEEIDMNEDTPDELVGDLSAEACWGDSSFAMPILGTKENVRRFTQADLFAYERRFYVASNAVLSVVGNIQLAQAVQLAETYFDFPQGTVQHRHVLLRTPCVQIGKKKDVEQTNIVLSYDGLARYDDRSGALSVLDGVFGGGMSSLLFQRVREQLGLAYSVYSYPSSYVEGGSYNIYIGTNPAKVGKALQAVRRLVDEVRLGGIDAEQLSRGVQQAKSAYIFGVESGMAIMRAQARRLLHCNQPFDENQEVAQLRQVDLPQVNQLISYLFARQPSIGVVARTIADYKEYFDGQ